MGVGHVGCLPSASPDFDTETSFGFDERDLDGLAAWRCDLAQGKSTA